jgi:hypothetical protein
MADFAPEVVQLFARGLAATLLHMLLHLHLSPNECRNLGISFRLPSATMEYPEMADFGL